MNSWLNIKSVFARLATEKAALISLLAISVAVNLFLANQVVRSRDQIDLLWANRKLTIGEKAPILNTSDENGQKASVDLSGRQYPTLLYFQSVNCHWCEQNAITVRELGLQAPGRYQFISLLLEPAARSSDLLVYPNSQKLFDPSTESKLSFDLHATPMTILFSPQGEVQKIWRGAYHDERKIDIEKTLGIQLSGLTQTF